MQYYTVNFLYMPFNMASYRSNKLDAIESNKKLHKVQHKMTSIHGITL